MHHVFRRIGAHTPTLTRGLRGNVPSQAYSLEEKLASLNPIDTELSARVDIGFARQTDKDEIFKENLRKKIFFKRHKLNSQAQDLAREGNLVVDYIKQKQFWYDGNYRKDIALAADHYGIFTHLYEHGYFYPAIPIEVSYPTTDDNCNPVHMGNILLPHETMSLPDVCYPAEPDELFTLVMTSLDSNLESSDKEYLHWMVGNIPGNDVSKGQTVCDYMQAFVPKGVGYHRFVFVLYKQVKKMDFSTEQRPSKCVSLRDRNFSTFEFCTERQDNMTPCGIAFFQSKWDDSLMDFYHKTLEMKAPMFEYAPIAPKLAPFKKFPEGKSFNEYIDLYRDPREIAEDIYSKRLKKIDPFKEEAPPLKHPFAQPMGGVTSWIQTEMVRERAFEGKYRHLKKFSIYPEGEPRKYKGRQK